MCLESFDSDSFNDGFCHSTSRFDECLSVDSVSECRRYWSYLLRIGEYEPFAGKTIGNNVYMDMRGKKLFLREQD